MNLRKTLGCSTFTLGRDYFWKSYGGNTIAAPPARPSTATSNRKAVIRGAAGAAGALQCTDAASARWLERGWLKEVVCQGE